MQGMYFMERKKILYDTWKKLGTTRKTKLDMTHSLSNDKTHLLYVKNKFRIKCTLIFAHNMSISNLFSKNMQVYVYFS